MKTVRTVSAGQANRSSRKGGTVFPYLALIALGAFLVRFIVSWQLIRNDPAVTAPSPITDMKTYLDLADGILRGDFPKNFYYQPFYYAVFLPLCRIFGGVWLLALAQSLLGGISVYLAGLCARFCGGRKAGIFGALLAGCCAISIYFTPYALLEVLQAFWIVLLMFLALRLNHKFSMGLWTAAGLVLGCSILTRGNCWCFLPVLLYAVFRQAPWKTFLTRAAVLLVLVLLPQLPFAAYNTWQNGRLSGPSTAGGAVLAFGNTPEGAPAGLEIPYPKTYELWLSREKEISIPRRMWEWFKAEPGAFLEQQFEKVMLFWDAVDYPNNITELNAQKSPVMQTVRFLPSSVLLFLGLAGLLSWFCRRGRTMRRRPYLLLTAAILLYALSISAFYILARFRVPVMPLLAASGGVFIAGLLRRNPFSIRIRLIGLGALAVFIVFGFMPLYSMVYEPLVISAVRPLGVQTEFETSPYDWPDQPDGPYLLITDHSSALKGGWGGIGSNFTVIKTFLPKRPPRGGRALLVLPVFGPEGSAVLTVNGERQSVRVRKNLICAEVPVRYENGKIQLDITLSEAVGDWTCAMDSRRDYGRTLFNGKPAPCELAAFLILPVSGR
ncbi:MAG: hypothetical protein E7055_09575 [Lentisphaerae bacterium]|nr:hypothetical protein [Lentisphaerota bacterium]